jgi:hypothetical protein
MTYAIGTEISFTKDTFGLRANGGTGVVVGRNFFFDRVQSYIVREHSDREGYTLSGDIVVPSDYVSAA